VVVERQRARILAELDEEERKLLAACPTCHRRFRRRRRP
jgi:hypothetical protein